MSDILTHIRRNEDFWGTSAFHWAHLTQQVSQLHFVAHVNKYNTGALGQPPTNHWSIFLVTGPHSSVRIDSVSNAGGQPGRIVIEDKLYEVTKHNTKLISIPAPPALTVANILYAIIANKRDRYIYTPAIEGCRYWLYTLANDLAASGVIDPAYVQHLEIALNCYWPYPVGSQAVAHPMVPGMFFTGGLCLILFLICITDSERLK